MNKITIKFGTELKQHKLVINHNFTTKIASANNVADPLKKALSQKVFEKHLEAMGVKYMYDWFLVQVGDC